MRVQARKKLTDLYKEDVLSVLQCHDWFAKLRSDNFKFKDAPLSGRTVEANRDAIYTFIDANRRITTPEIGFKLYIYI